MQAAHLLNPPDGFCVGGGLRHADTWEEEFLFGLHWAGHRNRSKLRHCRLQGPEAKGEADREEQEADVSLRRQRGPTTSFVLLFHGEEGDANKQYDKLKK